MRTDKNKSNAHKLLSATGWSLLLIGIATIFVHFSWNMAIPELFGAAKMSFKNAFGLVMLVATIAVILAQSATRRNMGIGHHASVKSDNA